MKKRFVLAMVLCIALCLAFGGAAYASSGGSLGYVTDTVGLLTQEEQRELETTAAQLAESYGCGVYVIIVEDYTDYTNGGIEDFSEAMFDHYGLGLGDDRNCLLLSLSMSERDYDLDAHGSIANRAFTDYGKEQLAQEFIDDFRYDNWFDGFRDYLSTAGQYLEAAENGTPVDVYGDSGEIDPAVSTGVNILFIVGIPCLISLAVCGIFAAQMKTARRQTGARGYISHGGVDMRVTQDQFLYHTETRQPIPQNDNNSGGGTTINSAGHSHSSGKF